MQVTEFTVYNRFARDEPEEFIGAFGDPVMAGEAAARRCSTPRIRKLTLGREEMLTAEDQLAVKRGMLRAGADIGAVARGPFDGYVYERPDGHFEAAAQGHVIDVVGAYDIAVALVEEHGGEKPRWRVDERGEARRIG